MQNPVRTERSAEDAESKCERPAELLAIRISTPLRYAQYERFVEFCINLLEHRGGYGHGYPVKFRFRCNNPEMNR